MSRHPMTDHARRLARESEEGYLILRLCEALDKEYADKEAALIELADSAPWVLGYVVIGRDGEILVKQFKDRDEAQAMADEWTADCKQAGIDWDYRVAEITEPTT